MAAGITHEIELPYGPEDNPYTHWARCMAAPVGPRDGPTPPSDGRRLRRREGSGETWAVPLVVRLGGAPGSRERDRLREALGDRVAAGELRMDAHEHDLLGKRLRDGRAGAGKPGPVAFDAPPHELLEREVYCLFRPSSSKPIEMGHVVEQSTPVIVPSRPLRAVVGGTDRSAERKFDDGDPPVIGVIDDGLAFLNARFRRPDGRTRFDAVWMQGFRTFEGFDTAAGWPFGGRARHGFAGGAETHLGAIVEADDINHLLGRGEALDEAAVYARLSRAVHDDPDNHHALEHLHSHGTHVADLAAGADPLIDGGDADVRRWPLLGVQLPPEAVSDTAGHHLRLLAITAVRWILHRARWLGRGPVIVTISFGALAGPKDGSWPIEWAIADELALFEARTGRTARVNWSFGNARLNRQVARIEPNEARGPIDWRLQPDDRAASFLELRPDELGRVGDLTLEIALPGGRTVTLPAPRPTQPVTVLVDGRPAMRLYHAPVPAERWGEGPVEAPHLVLAAAPTTAVLGRGPRAPAGAYRIVPRWAGAPGALRLEVQRGDTPIEHPVYGRQSYLDHPLAYAYEAETAAHTSPSRSPITRAGSHTANAESKSGRVWSTGAARPGRTETTPRPARYASAGRLGSPVLGPTISARAERGVATRGLLASGTLSGTVRASGGSSAAAPCASRALALTLAGRAGPARPGRDEAREVAERHGVVADGSHDGEDVTRPDHLEPSDGPEPGDVDRLGAGTVLAGTGRPWE